MSMLVVVFLLASVAGLVLGQSDGLEVSDPALFLRRRLLSLRTLANTSVLVLVHVPKVAGTALSLALAADCRCAHGRRRKRLASGASFPLSLLCRNCPRVWGEDGFSFPSSVSRVSGWRFGVHPSFAKLHLALRNGTNTRLGERGIVPVFLVPLREPFARFVSEAAHEVRRNEVGVDWSIFGESLCMTENRSNRICSGKDAYSLSRHTPSH